MALNRPKIPSAKRTPVLSLSNEALPINQAFRRPDEPRRSRALSTRVLEGSSKVVRRPRRTTSAFTTIPGRNDREGSSPTDKH